MPINRPLRVPDAHETACPREAMPNKRPGAAHRERGSSPCRRSERRRGAHREERPPECGALPQEPIAAPPAEPHNSAHGNWTSARSPAPGVTKRHAVRCPHRSVIPPVLPGEDGLRRLASFEVPSHAQDVGGAARRPPIVSPRLVRAVVRGWQRICRRYERGQGHERPRRGPRHDRALEAVRGPTRHTPRERTSGPTLRHASAPAERGLGWLGALERVSDVACWRRPSGAPMEPRHGL